MKDALNQALDNQMAATAKQVSKSVEEVAGVAEENSAATDSVSEAAQEITGQFEQVVVAGGTLARMAENFKRLVDKYKDFYHRYLENKWESGGIKVVYLSTYFARCYNLVCISL